MPEMTTGNAGAAASHGPTSRSSTASKSPPGTFRIPAGAVRVSSALPSAPIR